MRSLVLAFMLLQLYALAQDEWITYFMVRFDPNMRTRLTDINELTGQQNVISAPPDSSRLKGLGFDFAIKGKNHVIGLTALGASEALVGNPNFRYTYSYLPQGSVLRVTDTISATIDMFHFRVLYGYGTNTRKTNALLNVFFALDHVVGRLIVVDPLFAAYVQSVNNGRQPPVGLNELNQFRSDLIGGTLGANVGLATFRKKDLQVLLTLTPVLSINHRTDKLLDGTKLQRGWRSSVGLSLGFGLGGTWKRYRTYH